MMKISYTKLQALWKTAMNLSQHQKAPALDERPTRTAITDGHDSNHLTIESLAESLGEGQAQELVTQWGDRILQLLETELGYDEMQSLLHAAGLDVTSHWPPVPGSWDGRIQVTDPADYGRQLSQRERLRDRARRLDNLVQAVLLFGLVHIRRHPKEVRAYLFDHRQLVKISGSNS